MKNFNLIPYRAARWVFMLGLILLSFAGERSIQAASATPPPVISSPEAILQSEAYTKFKRRPVSDYSKLVYLIERFKDADLEVYYDGYYYKASFAAWVAQYFLTHYYKKQTVKEWIMLWCNTTAAGNLIYVKFADGKFRLSREVLIEEWQVMESVIASQKK